MSALNSQWAMPPPRLFKRADELLIDPKPQGFLIERYLPEASISALVGASGCAKSFIAIDWACSIGTGSPWLNHATKPRSVYVLAGEGQRGLAKRIRAWSLFHRQALDGFPIFVSTGMPALAERDPAQIVSLMDQVEIMQRDAAELPGLIVVDTLARAMAGYDENSAGDMGRLMDAMAMLRDRFDAAVLLVHHTGHNAARARGSSAFFAALDAEFQVTRDGMTVELRSTKEKDWATPPTLRMRMATQEIGIDGEDGQPEASLVLTSAEQVTYDKAAMRDLATELNQQGKSLRVIEAATGIPKSSLQRLLKCPAEAVPNSVSHVPLIGGDVGTVLFSPSHGTEQAGHGGTVGTADHY